MHDPSPAPRRRGRHPEFFESAKRYDGAVGRAARLPPAPSYHCNTSLAAVTQQDDRAVVTEGGGLVDGPGRRAVGAKGNPHCPVYRPTAVSSRYSSSVNRKEAARTFSSRCSIEEVPGMGSTTADRFNSQASATCLGVLS